ncbi:DNA cytosine methyltransferase [Pseudomonas syringae]|uniref:DNA cytosine methyltransferase n=1 Tax=Pseudomonas syringae TaxID=317 RepID=UPI0009B0D8D9|nr:DNA cytosine methyltransferase [Pseudomonas syringae]OSN58627.1 putative BsuMI modification methylase subunit YdiO [Pseudomonas syringae pv. actinidiae]OSN66301.1 putative BsuMI modification methylase subunit YdiO [Pseudomonas syringae pv. actinidiae]RMS05504.1 hypothetical protein ALP75_205325 [Pseudomonas syringae pv. actinidiae]
MADLGLQSGDLDLLAGCPPCQGFSTHRTRNRASSVIDGRNDLVFEFMKFVVALRPKTIMMENVPGLARDGRIESVKIQLSEMGYIVNSETVQVKDAANYGVPQRRKRMILKASMLGLITEPEQSGVFRTVKDTIGDLADVGLSGDVLHDIPVKRSDKVQKMISLVPKNGGSRKDLPKEYWLPCHKKASVGYADVYGRMSWDLVAPTITGGCINLSKGRFLHPEKNRAITLREAALLQTFPKDYRFSFGKGKCFVALMIGNALPPEFIKRHALEFRKHLNS